MGGHEEAISRIIEEKGAREAFHRLVMLIHRELKGKCKKILLFLGGR